MRANGIQTFVIDNKHSEIAQLRSMYEYLLKNARFDRNSQTPKSQSLRIAELTTLLMRIKRRWDHLSTSDKDKLRKSKSNWDRALAGTGESGYLKYPFEMRGGYQAKAQQGAPQPPPPTNPVAKTQQKALQLLPLAQADQAIPEPPHDKEVDEQQQTFSPELEEDLTPPELLPKLDNLEHVEIEALQIINKRKDLVTRAIDAKQTAHKNAIMRELVGLDVDDKKLRDRRKRIINGMKSQASKVKEANAETASLLDEATLRLRKCEANNLELAERCGTLDAKRAEREDTMVALAEELNKVRKENYFLQEVVVALQKEIEMKPHEQQQEPESAKLKRKLEQDREILENRIQEAKQMRDKWGSILQKQQLQLSAQTPAPASASSLDDFELVPPPSTNR